MLLVAVACGSLLPESGVLYLGSEMPFLLWDDKLIHFMGYFGLSLFAALGFSRAAAAYGAAGSMILLGAGLEFGQRFVAGRSADVRDALFNAAGTLIGAAAACLIRGLAARRRHSPPPRG